MQDCGSDQGGKVVETLIEFKLGRLWLDVLGEDIIFELIDILVVQSFADILDALLICYDLAFTKAAPIGAFDSMCGMDRRLE